MVAETYAELVDIHDMKLIAKAENLVQVVYDYETRDAAEARDLAARARELQAEIETRKAENQE